jgi:hypothetical protein
MMGSSQGMEEGFDALQYKSAWPGWPIAESDIPNSLAEYLLSCIRSLG